jgi:hypothetical protein
MSNRGRQNVASFLTKDLYYDWRLGAEWFESMVRSKRAPVPDLLADSLRAAL